MNNTYAKTIWILRFCNVYIIFLPNKVISTETKFLSTTPVDYYINILITFASLGN